MPREYKRHPLDDRFRASVDVRGPDDCWPWMRPRMRDGYAQISLGGRNSRKVKVHRVAFFLKHGYWPRPMCLHSCEGRYPPGDVTYRGCCNPAHLREGTHRDNTDDMVASGRVASGDRNASRLHPERRPRGDQHAYRRMPEVVPRGERNGKAKLTEDAVRAIRASAEIARIVGDRFGVGTTTVYYIRAGRIWKHVT